MTLEETKEKKNGFSFQTGGFANSHSNLYECVPFMSKYVDCGCVMLQISGQIEEELSAEESECVFESVRCRLCYQEALIESYIPLHFTWL